jgi:hypothetical protein
MGKANRDKIRKLPFESKEKIPLLVEEAESVLKVVESVFGPFARSAASYEGMDDTEAITIPISDGPLQGNMRLWFCSRAGRFGDEKHPDLFEVFIDDGYPYREASETMGFADTKGPIDDDAPFYDRGVTLRVPLKNPKHAAKVLERLMEVIKASGVHPELLDNSPERALEFYRRDPVSYEVRALMPLVDHSKQSYGWGLDIEAIASVLLEAGLPTHYEHKYPKAFSIPPGLENRKKLVKRSWITVRIDNDIRARDLAKGLVEIGAVQVHLTIKRVTVSNDRLYPEDMKGDHYAFTSEEVPVEVKVIEFGIHRQMAFAADGEGISAYGNMYRSEADHEDGKDFEPSGWDGFGFLAEWWDPWRDREISGRDIIAMFDAGLKERIRSGDLRVYWREDYEEDSATLVDPNDPERMYSIADDNDT